MVIVTNIHCHSEPAIAGEVDLPKNNHKVILKLYDIINKNTDRLED